MKNAVVIGAGKIGGAIAEHLTVLGCAVKAVGHDRLELAHLGAVGQFFSECDSIDILVNAAGSYGAIGSTRDVAPADWRRALEVNLLGVYACCHHALPLMAKGGHIVNIAGGGRGPMPMRSGYACAKSALWRFTETLADEERELHVNAIAPGPMDSHMQDAVIGFPAEWANAIRKIRDGRGGDVPVDNTLRVLDHILHAGPTGQLFFAREFSARPALMSSR